MAEHSCSDEHFVDEHWIELIKRVKNVVPILDELLDKKVIQQESYDAIMALPASQERMRALLIGPLESSGVQGKEIFYKILKINEPHLIDDLERRASLILAMQRATVTAKGLSPGTKVKHSVDEEQPSLIQRVETMVSVIELLLDTLADLSHRQLEMIWTNLRKTGTLRPQSDIPLRSQRTTDLQMTVFLMVQLNGRMSVEKTMGILKRMSRTDLVQRLSHTTSGAKKKHSVDVRLPALIHKVASLVAVRELLSETFMNLSLDEQQDFKFFLQFTLFQRSPHNLRGQLWQAGDASGLAELMVETCGQQSLEVTMELFMDMERTDLVQRLSETSSGPKAAGSSAEASAVNTTEGEKPSVDEHGPALTQRVEAMVSVIELLLETLKDLRSRLFMNVLLSQPNLHRRLLIGPMIPLHISDMKHAVFSMVLLFGQQSVETTTEVLKQMRRTDLVKRLSDSNLEVEKTHSTDERRSALIHRVATMAAVKELLLETLSVLHDWEYKKFRRFLQLIVPRMHLPNIMLADRADRAVTVDLMVQTYGQLSVELTREVFLAMNRTDLVQRLSEFSSGSKEKHSAGEHQPTLLERVAAVKRILLETLNKLSERKLEKFIWLLPFTCFQKSLPQISWRQRTWPERTHFVDAMVVTCGQQSVDVTKEVLLDMNRTDLVQMLSQTSSRFKEGHQSQILHKEVNTILLQERLLETLENLSYVELQEFKHFLQHVTMKKGLPEIPRRRMAVANKGEITEVLVETYGKESEEVIREALKEMKSTEEERQSQIPRPLRPLYNVSNTRYT
ncbi:uncharacterized protein LOC143324370 [Chaetodon auriga]|uniref:uncharacterized protein LOC143324370 n=1 Tax=Chaetodon auriga TaxID=39042 RepID=UPI004032F698